MDKFNYGAAQMRKLHADPYRFGIKIRTTDTDAGELRETHWMALTKQQEVVMRALIPEFFATED